MSGKQLVNEVTLKHRITEIKGATVNTIIVQFPSKLMRAANLMQGDVLGYEWENGVLTFSIKYNVDKISRTDKLGKLSGNYTIVVSPNRVPELFSEFVIPQDKPVKVPFEMVEDTLVVNLSAFRKKLTFVKRVDAGQVKKVASFAGLKGLFK